MNVPVLVVTAIPIVVITAAALRTRGRRRPTPVRVIKRDVQAPRVIPLPHVEQKLGDGIFQSIRKTYANLYGDVFAGFSVFRIGSAVRMDLATKVDWRKVSGFHQGMALRGIWRALQGASRAQDVTIYVDRDAPDGIKWTGADTEAFKDRGKAEPWAPSGPVGTLVSSGPPTTREPSTRRLRDRC